MKKLLEMLLPTVPLTVTWINRDLSGDWIFLSFTLSLISDFSLAFKGITWQRVKNRVQRKKTWTRSLPVQLCACICFSINKFDVYLIKPKTVIEDNTLPKVPCSGLTLGTVFIFTKCWDWVNLIYITTILDKLSYLKKHKYLFFYLLPNFF